MSKFIVRAKRTHWYEVEVEATGEVDACDQVRDWMAEDWEDQGLEVQAQWDFDATEIGDNK